MPKVNLFVDFESELARTGGARPSMMPVLSAEAQPTDAEKAVYEKVAAVLERAPRIIDELGGYTGAGEQIREVSFMLLFLLMLTYFLNCIIHFTCYMLCSVTHINNNNYCSPNQCNFDVSGSLTLK